MALAHLLNIPYFFPWPWPFFEFSSGLMYSTGGSEFRGVPFYMSRTVLDDGSKWYLMMARMAKKCNKHGCRSNPSGRYLNLKTSGYNFCSMLMVMRWQTFGGRAPRMRDELQGIFFLSKQHQVTTEEREFRAIPREDFPQTFGAR